MPRIWNTWTGKIDLTKSNNILKRQIKQKLTQQYSENVFVITPSADNVNQMTTKFLIFFPGKLL